MKQSDYDKLLIKWVKNHYWDSLEKDKDLILRHLRTFVGDIDTNAVLTSQSSGLAKLVKNQQDMPSEFNRAVDKMLDDEIANR